MMHTPTVRKAIVLGFFFVIQFFWLTAAFTYSDTDRSIDRPARPEQGSVPDVSEVRGISSVHGSVGGSAGSAPNMTILSASFNNARSAFALAGPGSDTSSQLSTSGDLGAQIKYCIVFPLLNSAGSPIPTFNVPVCPLGPGGPEPSEDPRLTVTKIVVNDDSGAATTTDFALFVNSTRVASGATVSLPAGSYVVSEATTTVPVGTTTLTYVQDFGGDCNASGNVMLSAGDSKTCIITNDDPGPGGQGGEGNNGGNGGNGDGVDGSSGSASSGGSSGGGRSGRILGQAAPDYMGGADGIPGIPNTGRGGAEGNLGLLLFSFMGMIFSFIYLRIVSNAALYRR